MSRLAQAEDLHAVSNALNPRPGLWARLRRHLKDLNAAHALQARYMCLGGEVCRDLALPPEEVLGEPTYDPALPFYFQSGFDRR